jgi:hypothetical protein
MRALLPAIGFLAIERRHVGLEVAAGLKDTAFRQVSVTGEDGVLDNPIEESSCGERRPLLTQGHDLGHDGLIRNPPQRAAAVTILK